MDLFAVNLCGQKRNEYLSSKHEEMHNLMTEVLPSCHFSAKRHRLDCLYFIIVHVCKVVKDRDEILFELNITTKIALGLNLISMHHNVDLRIYAFVYRMVQSRCDVTLLCLS